MIIKQTFVLPQQGTQTPGVNFEDLISISMFWKYLEYEEKWQSMKDLIDQLIEIVKLREMTKIEKIDKYFLSTDKMQS